MRDFIDIHTHNFTNRHTELHAVGIHPWNAEKIEISEVCDEQFTSADAIGEIGLDYACEVDRTRQEELFCRQLAIAQRTGKPVVLHCVKAFEPTMNLLLRYSLKTVIFHGFIGSKTQAEAAIKRGYFLSFGHPTARSPKSIEALRATPLSQLFVETDESGLSIEDIYREIAHLRGVSTEELIAATHENWNRIFSKVNE